MRCEDTVDQHGSIEVDTVICETQTECVVGPDNQVAHDVVVWNYKRNKAYFDIEVQSSEQRVVYEHGDGSKAEQRDLLVGPRTSEGPGKKEERFWIRSAPDASPGSDILTVKVRYALLREKDQKNTSVPESFPEVEVR
jgi:hypothetical protein